MRARRKWKAGTLGNPARLFDPSKDPLQQLLDLLYEISAYSSGWVEYVLLLPHALSMGFASNRIQELVDTAVNLHIIEYQGPLKTHVRVILFDSEDGLVDTRSEDRTELVTQHSYIVNGMRMH